MPGGASTGSGTGCSCGPARSGAPTPDIRPDPTPRRTPPVGGAAVVPLGRRDRVTWFRGFGRGRPPHLNQRAGRGRAALSVVEVRGALATSLETTGTVGSRHHLGHRSAYVTGFRGFGRGRPPHLNQRAGAVA